MNIDRFFVDNVIKCLATIIEAIEEICELTDIDNKSDFYPSLSIRLLDSGIDDEFLERLEIK